MTEMDWISIDGDLISLKMTQSWRILVLYQLRLLELLLTSSLKPVLLRLERQPGNIWRSKDFLLKKYYVPFLVFRCLADYTEAEQGLLLSLVNAAANFECIQHCLAKSCNDFVSNNVRTMLGLPTGSATFPFSRWYGK